MKTIKLQIAGCIYYTIVKEDKLNYYLDLLNETLAHPNPNVFVIYDAENTDNDFIRLVFKETALEAYCVLN